MGTVIQITGAGTGGTQSALANIDVPMDGVILGVSWAMGADLDTDLDQVIGQLSFGTTYTSANDARQVIDNCQVRAAYATAAAGVAGNANKYTALPDVPVGMGERIYLHVFSTATTLSDIFVTLHFDFDLDKVKTRRR